jgi:hypothetical protein
MIRPRTKYLELGERTISGIFLEIRIEHVPERNSVCRHSDAITGYIGLRHSAQRGVK